jgi:hypothetical protein
VAQALESLVKAEMSTLPTWRFFPSRLFSVPVGLRFAVRYVTTFSLFVLLQLSVITVQRRKAASLVNLETI